MRKTKHSWAAFVGEGNKRREKMIGENERILPKATHEERKKQEAKRKGKLKTLAGKLLKTVVGGKETVEKAGAEGVAGNLLKRPISRKGVERGTPAEETICRFIEQGKFLEACDQIHHLEHSGNDSLGKSESLYALLAERMWTTVGEALNGNDRMLLEPLQSVGESLKWEKQKEAEWLGNSLETESVSTWSPNFWRKDLEEKLMEYMTAQIPLFVSSTNTDETALKQHLSHLETAFLPSLEHRSAVFKEAGLLVTFARCCHASLCSHLATLSDSYCFSFSQTLLIYEWIIKMHKSGSQACVRSGHTPQHSLSLGAQCLVWCLWKTEEKLLAIARKEVGKALKEAFDIGKPPRADAAVIEILTEKTEAARRVSESLSEKVEAECLEECLRFLERTVWHKLTYICSVSTDQNVKVNGVLHRMEDDIMEHFLQTITSKVKGTLKAYFKKCDNGFDHILESLKQSFLTFRKKKPAIYVALVEAVNAIIITEYMQALLTTPRKPSAMQRRRIINKIEEDHRMMQTIFKECLGPAAGSLKDPIKAILELIQTSDPEGMKIALLPFLKEFPDLRKEHLSAVLDIKDSLSREDRAALLKTFHDNCRESETEANLLFADIEVKPRKYGLCGCLCC
ncbi:exocyst complex component 3-like isoform X2 [Oenanthe melanoleuca]|uniref:exocyst complex component 3-like isoform X2 n=1 Tax=Oenanthe melanoleuca TaxID=2939378 RepID=UPI0024C1D028|nr:exocyst complex component 3-like isoform X2 [Oenanthe melanoleuca]